MSSRPAVAIKVPLWRTLGEAIRQVFGDLKAVGRFGWRAFLVLTLFGLATQLAYANGLLRPVPGASAGTLDLRGALFAMLVGLGALVVDVLCYNAFMVGWYRHVLKVGQDVQTRRGYWPAFWRVLGYYVLLVIGLIAFILVLALLGGIVLAVLEFAGQVAHTSFSVVQVTRDATVVGAIASIVGAVVYFFLWFTRASLMFPAAACGNRLGFRSAWRTLRGNTWRMIAAFLLLIIAFVAVELVLTLTFNADAFMAAISGRAPRAVPQPTVLATLITLVGRFIFFLFLALTTSVTAIFYRDLALRPHDVVEVFA